MKWGYLTLGIVLLASCRPFSNVKEPLAFNTPKLSCNDDLDCVAVAKDCCNCNHGGTAIAVNEDFKTEWEGLLANTCGDTACLTVISEDPSCFQKPVCNNNKCTLQ